MENYLVVDEQHFLLNVLLMLFSSHFKYRTITRLLQNLLKVEVNQSLPVSSICLDGK